MALVRVKAKYQVTLPDELRKQIGVGVGDLLEAKVERGKITFVPKTVVDRGIAQSLQEYAQGKGFGPFDSHEAFIASLHKEAKKLRAKKNKRSAE